jgi:hypothetical protein
VLLPIRALASKNTYEIREKRLLLPNKEALATVKKKQGHHYK